MISLSPGFARPADNDDNDLRRAHTCLYPGLSQLTQSFGQGNFPGSGALTCSSGGQYGSGGGGYPPPAQSNSSASSWIHEREVHNLIENVSKGEAAGLVGAPHQGPPLPGTPSSCLPLASASPGESNNNNNNNGLSPSSPSQCSMSGGGPLTTQAGEGEDIWRGSSIASLRRRAFEHSAVSMTVFR